MNIQGGTQSGLRNRKDPVFSGEINIGSASPELYLKHTTHPNQLADQQLNVPFWLWPNVLSLDAAFIAALWHTFLAHLLRLQMSLAEPVVLALSVWIIYVLDHILDSRGAVPVYDEPIRKLFYRQHAKPMLAVAGVSVMLTGVLAALALPALVLRLGTAIALSVAIYLGTVHTMPIRGRRSWPREAVVGLLFSIGTVLPLAFLIDAQVPVVLACGSLLFPPVWANCCAVEAIDWERAGRSWAAAPHVTAIWISEHLTDFAGLVFVLSLFLSITGRVPAPFAAATVLSSLAIAFAGSRKTSLSADTRSLLVDVALCSPLLIPLARWNHT